MLCIHDDKERLQKTKLPQQERCLLEKIGIEVSQNVIKFTEDAKKVLHPLTLLLEQLHADTKMHEEIQKLLGLLRKKEQTSSKLYNDLLQAQTWEQELIELLEKEQQELLEMLEEQVHPN